MSTAASGDVQLLPYQLEPALALLRHACNRILIADEVGLGKTIQAGFILAELSAAIEDFRGMVLAPAPLLDQWVQELERRMHLAAQRADARWLMALTRQLPAGVNPWALPGLYVASLDLVKRPEVLNALEDVTWDILVVDEAHTVGAATARRTAADALALRSRRVLLLTATPPEGDPAQMSALMSVGEAADGIAVFRRSRQDIGYESGRKTTLLQVRLTSAERRMHRLLDQYTALVWSESSRLDSRARLAATLLRKRALSCASSLRSSVQRRIALLRGEPVLDQPQLLLPLGDEDPLDDDTADSVLSVPGLRDSAMEHRMLIRVERAAAAAMRRESKVRVLLRYLRRAAQPAIVFTEYRDTLVWLDAAVRDSGRSTVLLHGGMHHSERAQSIRRFERGGGILLATDAASEGLNLHHTCRLVVHFELPWTLSRMEQRRGRVDRLGQTRAVHEVVLVARDSAERAVLVPLVRRMRSAISHGNKPAGMLLALTESLVAGHVIAGEPLDVPTTAAAVLGSRFEQEGLDEARRLACERQHTGRPGALTENRPLLTAVRRPRRRCTTTTDVTFLWEVILTDTNGQSIHREPVAQSIQCEWDGDRRARSLRRFVQTLLAEHCVELRALAECATERTIAEASRRRASVAAALRRRETTALSKLPSAAQRLVQAGLFDRRIVKHHDRQQSVISLMAHDAEERARTFASDEPKVTVRLTAVRVGARTGR